MERFLIDDQGRTKKRLKPLVISPTLRREMHGNEPRVVEPIGWERAEQRAKVDETKTEGERVMTDFKYVSLFSGVGGFEQALNKLGGKCVFASEIDKFASKAYATLYGEDHLHGDVTKIDAKDVPDHDLLVGGFPCQSFSVAGKRGGFEDARGTLFFEMARIAKEKQPKIFLAENVKGLVGHDKGKTLDTIVKTLNEIGYRVDFNVLNSKYFGVPQNRERIFIVAVREDLVDNEEWTDVIGHTVVPKGKRRISGYEDVKTFNFDWPGNDKVTTRLRDILEPEVDEKYYLSEEKTAKLVAQLEGRYDDIQDGFTTTDKQALTVTSNYGNGIAPGNVSKKVRSAVVEPFIMDGKNSFGGNHKIFDEGIAPTLLSNDFKEPKKVVEPQMLGHVDLKGHDAIKRVYDTEGVAPTLTTMGGGHREPKIAEQQSIDAGIQENATKVREDELASTVTASYFKGLCGQSRPHVLGPKYRIRKLTPLETFRLQGFPDEAHQALVDAGISDSQRYKQAGNAVTVNVIEALGERLLPYLTKENES